MKNAEKTINEFKVNEIGVPLYPKGHVGRLLVTMAAINMLSSPTASEVAKITGLSKGNIDSYVNSLNSEFGTEIVKDGPVYRILSWGGVLKKSGVMRYLRGSIKQD